MDAVREGTDRVRAEERRVKLRRRLRDRQTLAVAETVAELRGRAAPLLAEGRPDLAAPFLESAELFESAYAGR